MYQYPLSNGAADRLAAESQGRPEPSRARDLALDEAGRMRQLLDAVERALRENVTERQAMSAAITLGQAYKLLWECGRFIPVR